MSQKFSTLLLKWYAQCGRDLPWRHKGGAHPNPYIVFVSELMLQQTTVKTVLSYFDRFIRRFGDVKTLAEAPLEEVYLYWQGLGYYTRAKSLHQSAQTVMNDFGGRFPNTREDVSKLKGFGPYTVASFLALAFNRPETVVDGNVMRIMARLDHLTSPLDEVLPVLRRKAESLTDPNNAADYASAIMDLGATVCTKTKPKCDACPVRVFCKSKSSVDVEQIPMRKKMTKKRVEGYVYIVQNTQGEVLIRKRCEPGLLSGLYEFLWSEKPLFDEAVDTKKTVSHIFTHIDMTLKIYEMTTDTPIGDGFFVPWDKLSEYAFSTLMQKVIQKYNHKG